MYSDTYSQVPTTHCAYSHGNIRTTPLTGDGFNICGAISINRIMPQFDAAQSSIECMTMKIGDIDILKELNTTREELKEIKERLKKYEEMTLAMWLHPEMPGGRQEYADAVADGCIIDHK